MSRTKNSDFFHVPGTPCKNKGQGWAIATEKKNRANQNKNKKKKLNNERTKKASQCSFNL